MHTIGADPKRSSRTQAFTESIQGAGQAAGNARCDWVLRAFWTQSELPQIDAAELRPSARRGPVKVGAAAERSSRTQAFSETVQGAGQGAGYARCDSLLGAFWTQSAVPQRDPAEVRPSAGPSRA